MRLQAQKDLRLVPILAFSFGQEMALADVVVQVGDERRIRAAGAVEGVRRQVVRHDEGRIVAAEVAGDDVLVDARRGDHDLAAAVDGVEGCGILPVLGEVALLGLGHGR